MKLTLKTILSEDGIWARYTLSIRGWKKDLDFVGPMFDSQIKQEWSRHESHIKHLAKVRMKKHETELLETKTAR